MKKRSLFILLICVAWLCVCSCGKETEETTWNVCSYEKQKDIISIEELDFEQMYEEGVEVSTYRIKYQSDECEVVSYLSVPTACLEEQKAYPCIIYNRGGNQDYGANKPEDIAYLAESSGKIIFASQYRGVDGGTGREQYGGDDLHDVLKLVDFCEEFSFVDMDKLYMMGVSRGGMMTYMAIREDDRIKKAVIVSGLADLFLSCEERTDMKQLCMELIDVSPEENPEEYEKRSATYWADEINCPVLMIHSKLDEKVSFAQAEKMANALEDAEKEYTFVTYEDDVHGLHPEDFELIMDWCN